MSQWCSQFQISEEIQTEEKYVSRETAKICTNYTNYSKILKFGISKGVCLTPTSSLYVLSNQGHQKV